MTSHDLLHMSYYCSVYTWAITVDVDCLHMSYNCRQGWAITIDKKLFTHELTEDMDCLAITVDVDCWHMSYKYSQGLFEL